MHDGDTIVALSSGAVPSGVAVIRLSGPRAGELLGELTGALPEPRRLTLSELRMDGEVIDRGLVAWFPAPRSFTGEDCAELQVHGSPAIVRILLRRLSGRDGVRLAEAGEFTRRAFENGKLDLVEIEGLGDLIQAETEGQRRQALARLDGELSRRVEAWRHSLLDLRAEIEARLDFSDEGDVGNDLPASVVEGVGALTSDMRRALASLEQGRIIRDGFRVALAGPPNAGKSSLLNALSRSDLAIVSDEPGTTRDVREVLLDLGGQLVVLVDMAGLREASSKAEAEGVRRARDEIRRADLVLWLVAPDVADEPMAVGDSPPWRVLTKSDLLDGEAKAEFSISAATGAGVDALLARIGVAAVERVGVEPALLSRERDREAITLALEPLEALDFGQLELAAEALRHSSHALARLLGKIDAEMVLDRLFAAFCIGK